MKVLITGGAGFIGSNLANFLIQRNHEVTILDSLSTQIHGEEPKNSELFRSIVGKVNFIPGDVANRSDWMLALEGQDAIVHLAAETGTGQSMYEIERYNRVNVMGTSILWDILAVESHQVKKVVVASSRAIYGEGKYYCKSDGVVFPLARRDEEMRAGDFEVKCPICHENVEVVATSEDSKKHPTSIYGFTKQAQEDISMIAGKSLGIPVVAYRYQNVYGPGQSLNNPYTGILSIFSKRIRNGNDIQIFEDGNESRDFVYIDDVVKATTLGLELEAANFKSLNVGTGVMTTVLTVAQTLKRLYDSNVEILVTGKYRVGDIRHNYADLSLIQEVLKFTPSYSFESGITNFVEWVKKQEIGVDTYAVAMNEMEKKGLFK